MFLKTATILAIFLAFCDCSAIKWVLNPIGEFIAQQSQELKNLLKIASINGAYYLLVSSSVSQNLMEISETEAGTSGFSFWKVMVSSRASSAISSPRTLLGVTSSAGMKLVLITSSDAKN